MLVLSCRKEKAEPSHYQLLRITDRNPNDLRVAQPRPYGHVQNLFSFKRYVEKVCCLSCSYNLHFTYPVLVWKNASVPSFAVRQRTPKPKNRLAVCQHLL